MLVFSPLLSKKKTMGHNNRLVLFVSLSSLFFFFYSAQSLCVPRNFTNPSGLIHKLPPLSVSSPKPKPPPISTQPPLSPPPISTQPPSSPPPISTQPPSSPPPIYTQPPPSQPPISTQPPPSQPPISTQPPPTPPVSASPPPLPAQPKPSPQPNTTQPIPPSAKPVPNGPVDPLVDTTCRATDYPELCLSSLRPYLHGGVDLITVLDDEIKACKDRVIAASNFAQKKIQDPQTAASVTSSLKNCKESYTDALENLQEAEDAMKIRDIGTVNSMLSAALTDFSDCDDFVVELPGGEQPTTREDATLEHLTSNCLAIASLIKL